MSVVGLTLGSAAKAIRPERGERRQRPHQGHDPRVRALALVPGEAAGQRQRQQCEGAQLPAHAIASGRRPRASERRALAGGERAAGAAQDPRGLGGEVAAAGQHLDGRARRRSGRRRPAAAPDRRRRPRTRGRGWPPAPRRRGRAAAGPALLVLPVHAPGRLVEAHHRGRVARRVAEHDGQRQPLLLASDSSRGWRSASAGAPAPPSPARGGASWATRLVHQVVVGVLQQQGHPPGAAHRARASVSSGRRRAAAASTSRRRCGPSAPPARRDATPARRRAGSPAPTRSSCHTWSKASAGRRTAATAPPAPAIPT